MEFLACISILLLYICFGYSFPVENDDVPYVEPEVLNNLYANGEYEEFARLLRIDDVNLVIPKEGNKAKDPTFNEGLPYGDILMTKQQKEESRQGIRFDTYPASMWPNGTIPYVIGDNQFSAQQIRDIRSAIENFNSLNTGVTFVQRSSQKDYVMMISGNGCYSNLGRVGGQQPLSLQNNGCVYRGIIQHEMIHAVGFTHEQNRPDRDEFVRVLWENIPPQWQSQYKKESTRDFKLLEPYDYYSVMHYGMSAPETGKKAFQILKPGINENNIGQRTGMTQSDISKIKKLYG